MVQSWLKPPMLCAVLLAGGVFLSLHGAPVKADKDGKAEDKTNSSVPDIFLPAPRELIQQLDHAKRDLRKQHYSDAVKRLGDLLHSSESEDYFISDGRQPGRMISLKAEADRILGEMSSGGRSAYELRFGTEAGRLLESAIGETDIDGLIDVSRKFFHTEAGQTATFILGRYHLDRGRPLAAGLALQRLVNAKNKSFAHEPELSMSLALAWLYAGLNDHAESVLNELSQQLPRLGTESVKLPDNVRGNPEATINWLNGQIVLRQQFPGSDESQWLVFRGNASRTARSVGDIPLVVSENPLVNCRWRVAIANNAGMESELQKIHRQYLAAGLPALPTPFPLAVGNVVLMRTPRNLFAVDSTTGKRVWLYDDLSSQLADDAFSGSMGSNDNLTQRNLLTGWHQRMWDDVPYGQMSSDGTNVYLINKLGYSTNLKVLVIKHGFNVRNPLSLRSYNELVALELATEGKRKWVVGGDQGENEIELAGAFFLGAPLPIANELYAMVEINGEISLVALSASSGKLIWKQPLIHTDESSGDIRVNPLRRTAGATPSFEDGVLICPTSAGALIAIDISTRSLLWGFQYDMKNARRNKRLWNLQHASIAASLPGSRWCDAVTTIALGKVLLTPVESDFIFCLRLLDGKLLWKQQRKANLFVAGVHKDKVVLVGKNAVSGLNLKDGRSAWSSTVKIPREAMPSGRGFISHNFYYQPTTARDILKIDIDTGEIVEQVFTGSILGNLICFDDCVISQNIDHLTSFHQVGALRERVVQRLADQPDDALALTEQAQLLLNDNQRQNALVALRRSYSLQPNDATRALLVDTLLKGLEEDFSSNERLATEVEKLIDQPVQRTEYLRLMTIGLQKVGKLAEAFAAGVKFIDSGLVKTEMERLGENWHVRRDRWIQMHLSNILHAASLPERTEMDRLVEQRLATAKEKPLVHALREFLECFGFHRYATEARWELARRLFNAKNYLEAEVLLTRLAQSTEPPFAVEANVMLAELYEDVGLFDKAAQCYRTLGTRWAGVGGLDSRTGVDWYEHAKQNPSIASFLNGDLSWPRGRVHVTRTKIDFRQYAIGYHQTHPVKNFRPEGYGLSDVNLALDWQQSLVGKDLFGEERFRVSLVLRDNRLRQPAKPRLTDVRAVGHLLIVSHGIHIVAVDAMPISSGQEDRVLWRKQLTPLAAGSTVIKQVHQKKLTNIWGDEQWITTIRGNGDKVRFGQMGPLTQHGLCFQRGSAIVCIDPLAQEKEPVWIQEGYAAGSDLFGDDEYLFVTEAGSTEASVIRCADGKLIGPRKVPPESNRWTTWGRYLLTWKKSGKSLVLILYDPWYEEDVWSYRFPLGSKGTIVGNRQVAVLQPDGRFAVIDIVDGNTTIDQQLEADEFLEGIHILPSRQRMILVTTGKKPAKDREILITSAPSGSYAPMINGKVYAFDPATGRSLWPVPAVIERYGLPLDQPVESPALIFLRHMRTNKERATAVRTSLLCLHKRDGRILVMNDDNAGHTGTYSMVVRPDDKDVTLSLASASYRMKFTSEHVPPEPPAQTGTAASFVAENASPAWKLFQAARRGIDSVVELPDAGISKSGGG